MYTIVNNIWNKASATKFLYLIFIFVWIASSASYAGLVWIANFTHKSMDFGRSKVHHQFECDIYRYIKHNIYILTQLNIINLCFYQHLKLNDRLMVFTPCVYGVKHFQGVS